MNRDSIVWTLGMLGGLLTYLAMVKIPPTEWDYMQWLQFLAAAVAVISGKLATSPLKGEHD